MTGPVLEDSRRLTGHNLLTPGPGAIIDVRTGDADPLTVMERWKAHARRILDAVGWSGERTFERRFAGGASLAFTAPIDALYAATEVNEWVWDVTLAELDGSTQPDFSDAVTRLQETIVAESNPRLLALQNAAVARGVSFIWDDDHVSVGMGSGSITWETRDLGSIDDIAWSDRFDVPVALVTGSNGKTTTVRLLAAIATKAGKTPGFSSTDGVFVAGDLVDGGDYSGPGGARAVLRDHRVDIAILETARGGLLRRGLGVPRADTAIVTNIAMDHFGEYGVDSLEDIASAKLVVARALEDPSQLILNAEDATLAARFDGRTSQPGWYSVQTGPRGALRAWVERDVLCFNDGNTRHTIVPVADVPITLDGAAAHNVSNALGAICVAHGLGFSVDAIRDGLTTFEPNATDSPGRTNLFRAHGVTIIVDFAHNPEGMDALVATAKRLSSRRTLLIIGQAGDRDDESIRAFARSAGRLHADRVIVKEMPTYLRGREPGVVTDLLETELRTAGTRNVVQASSELEAVDMALAWARAGDLLLVLTHEDRAGVLEKVEVFARAGKRE